MMKNNNNKKYPIMILCMSLCLVGCGSSGNPTDGTESFSFEQNNTLEASKATDSESALGTEPVSASEAPDESTGSFPGESMVEPTATSEATTESAAAVESESETSAETVIPVSVSAEISGNHFVGSTLSASDFTVIVTMSNGETITNPDGWWAEPLTLSGENNDITVGYGDLSTHLTCTADEAPEPAVSSGMPGIVETDTTLYTYDMMATDLYSLSASYPDICQLESAGQTADGRDIFVVYFGNRNADRQIFIGAATHGREYMTSQLVMKQLENYCVNYETGIYGEMTYRQIFDRTCFVVVPMINPDGVTISQLGEAGIRSESLRSGLQSIYNSDLANGYTSYDYATYLTRWKANASGVDLNRNFSPGWESVAERSVPSQDFYKGEYPGSEAEAVALMNIMNSLSNPLMAISYHSYGDLVYWQYGQPEPLWTQNQQLASHISDLSGHYLAGYSNEAGFSNWCVLVRGIPSVTVETGRVPTPLPIDQFPLLWSQHQYTWAMLGTTY